MDGEYFCELPLNMVADVVPWAERAAPALASAEPSAVKELTEYLLVSGLSMTVAGISRPSSGGEHLISHLWDMQNMQSGAELALHGIQVGIGTVLAARLYDEILALDSLDTRAILAGYPDPDSLRRRTDDFHGPVAGAVWEEFSRKLPSEERLGHIAKSWDVILEAIPKYRTEAVPLETALQTAGAPTHPSELGMPPARARDSIVHAREIRARYTGLDLAADIGILEDFASRHAHPPD
jgi:glycerol-1-phosphate dehydrogenase [NAD(P)+]